jgi:hypothetical protein
MHLVLEVAGGLASYMSRRLAVSDDDLSVGRKAALAAAVDAARREPAPPVNASARDQRSYEIRITDATGETTLVAYDGAVPPATRQLIDLITAIAREQKRP